MNLETAMANEPNDRVLAQRRALEVERRDRRRRLRRNEQDHFERTRVGERLRPTEEGERKDKERAAEDPIDRLIARGSLTDDEAAAALEIRAVYSAVCGSLLARSAWPDGRIAGRSSGMAEWLAASYRDSYKPWAEDLSRWYLKGGAPALAVAIDIIVSGESCREVERKYGWRSHGTAVKMLRHALALYCYFQGKTRNITGIMAYRHEWAQRAA